MCNITHETNQETSVIRDAVGEVGEIDLLGGEEGLELRLDAFAVLREELLPLNRISNSLSPFGHS